MTLCIQYSMILIHSPHTDNKEGKRGHDVVEIYKILHEYRSKGKIKSIGVSNFGIEQLRILHKACPNLAVPVVNQIECNPFLQEEELIEYCTKNGILIQSYCPLAQCKEAVRSNKVLKELAAKYDKTFSHIMLRWQIQKGFILLPKSVTPKRIIANGDLFSFELTQQDMAQLDELKKHKMRLLWNPMTIEWDDTYSTKEKEEKSSISMDDAVFVDMMFSVEAMNAKDELGTAAKILKDMIKSDPTNAELHYRLAVIAKRQWKNFEQAKDEFLLAVKHDPNHALSLFGLADLYKVKSSPFLLRSKNMSLLTLFRINCLIWMNRKNILN